MNETAKLERLLEGYLAEGKQERITVSDHIRHNTTALQHIVHQLELHEQKDDARHTELKAAIAGINARVDAIEDEQEITDRHDVTALQAQLADRKRNDFEWKKAAVAAMVAFLVALVSGCIGVASAWALRK